MICFKGTDTEEAIEDDNYKPVYKDLSQQDPSKTFNGNKMLKCLKGHQCIMGTMTNEAGTDLGYMKPCAENYYQEEYGKSTCIPCPGGHYCAPMGRTQAVACRMGTYRLPNEQVRCTLCPAGTYSDKTGVDND